MKRAIVRSGIALAFVALGWAAGRAQQTQPDFEIRIVAPAGKTQVECVRGCTLAWVERGVPDTPPTKTTFDFGCSNGGPTCSSSRVGGWIQR